MTQEQALELYNTNWWVGKSAHDIVSFQLFEERLCMPFDRFHEAVEKALNRPVFTREFGLNADGLKKEFLKERKAPTLEEIVKMIPESKRILVVVDEGD